MNAMTGLKDFGSQSKGVFTTLRGALMAFALMAGAQAQAFEYKLETKLPKEQRQAVLNVLAKAQSLLPEELKKAITTSVTVKVESIKSPHGAALGVASAKGNIISISKTFIPALLAGPERSALTGRQHKTEYEEALATVLHETTHLYDYANVHTDAEWKWISDCDTTFEQDQRDHRQPRPFACRYYEKMHTSFSANPYFLQVAGWMNSSSNGFSTRSPDLYELTDPKEFLAVNMEFFLLDPQYKCRRPGMYQVLSSQFKHVPFADVSCESELGYVVPNSSYKMAQLLSIDPARVYQVHYLFAEKGSAMMSGWGHAMIRLVVCSPQRKEVGPDCLRDVESHVVISFRAFVDSLFTSTWAGLSGKYPSRLFILPMNQVIDEYNKAQFRALRSLPLKMTREQIKNLITRSVEVHWGYEGKYYFISNNCATESLNLLQSSLLTPEILFTEATTPISLYDILVKQGLADASVLKDQKKALELGYYFDSYKPRYEKSFAIVQKSLQMPVQSFDEWFKIAASDRQKVIKTVTATTPNRLQTVAALYVLELAAQRSLQTEIVNELQGLITSKDENQDAASKEAAGTVKDNYLELAQLFAKPAAFLEKNVGYGLPDKSELQKAGALIDSKANQAQQIADETQKVTSQLTSEDLLKDAQVIQENIKLLQQLLNGK